jgi:hypothetical protein
MPPLSSGTYYAPLTSVLGKAPEPAVATAISNNGTVVGSYGLDGLSHGFVWDPKSGAILAVGIGYNDKPAQQQLSAFRYIGTELLDINDQGRIVGRIDFQAPGSSGRTSFAYWISLEDALLGAAAPTSAFHVLATPPAGLPKGSLFHAHGINDRNQIVGIYKDAGLAGPKNPPGTFGFVFTPNGSGAPWDGTFVSVAPPSDMGFSRLFGINDEGDLIGDCGTFDAKGTLLNYPYLWPKGANPAQIPVSVTSIAAPFGTGHKVSNNHVIVGGSSTTTNPLGAAIAWRGTAKPGNQPIAVDAPFQLQTGGATAIIGVNEQKCLVGTFTPSGGASEAFLIVP